MRSSIFSFRRHHPRSQVSDKDEHHRSLYDEGEQEYSPQHPLGARLHALALSTITFSRVRPRRCH